MFPSKQLFNIGLLAFLIQPCLFQQISEEDLCQANVGVGESEFSKKVEGTKIKADAIKLMHANGIMKTMHNGSLYMSYQFSSKFTYESFTYHLSPYTYNDMNFPAILCAFYGGYLPEIENQNVFSEIVKFLNVNSDVDCIPLGSIKRMVDGVAHWLNEFSGLSANTIFMRNPNYPTAAQHDIYTRLVKDNTTLASLNQDWFAINGPDTMRQYHCNLLCQVPK